jgi:DNA-binding NarL/FixJ family response regulator
MLAIRVLLADDHAVVREGLRLLIETHRDISVVGEAADGREAVSLAKQLQPDVVVMDITMPDLNGIVATRQIRNCCPSTQVVILSMHASTEHISQALRAGAKGYLLKEAAGKEVVQAIRAAHLGNRYLSRHITERVIEDYVRRSGSVPEVSPLERLSSREREILQLVVEGKANPEIASLLCLSVKTVETYRSRFMEKLEIKDLPSLVKFAIHHGLTTVK